MSKGNYKAFARISPDIREKLEAICEREGLTISDAVRAAIIAFIDSRQQRQE